MGSFRVYFVFSCFSSFIFIDTYPHETNALELEQLVSCLMTLSTKNKNENENEQCIGIEYS